MPKYFVIDVETTGLRPYHGDRVFSIAIMFDDGTVEIHRIDDEVTLVKAQYGRARVQHLLASDMPRVAHNAKFEIGMLSMSGFDPHTERVWHDTMIQSQLLNNMTASHALDYLAQLWADYPTDGDDVISRMAKECGMRYDKIPDAVMRKYQHTDVERTLLLHEFFMPKLLADARLYADYQNEMALVKVTQRFEATGITLDRKRCQLMLNKLQKDIDATAQEVYKELGYMCNLNSSQVVKHILFKILKFPVLEINEETGNAVVDKDILFEYRKRFPHPLLELILKIRSYTKAAGMIRNYLDHASEDGIIFPNIKTNHAKSGREASSEPNMQNVSKELNVKNPYPVPLRQCFRARQGYVLMFFDYAGIEMRLIIEATREPDMLALLKSGGDPHNIAAEIFYGKKFTEETDKKIKKSLRSAAKNAHFALAYGAGAGKLAGVLNISPEEASTRYALYKARFPLIGSFSKTTAGQVLSQGYVVTSFGRKLRINREKAYSASNYLIQGTAAGIIKRAQVQLERCVDTCYGWDKLRPLLPIHDELVVEMRRELMPRLRDVCADIRTAMVTMPDIVVPLDIEGKLSTNTWFDAKEIKL